MYKIEQLPPYVILGYQGENDVEKIEIDCTDWFDKYDGNIMVTHLAPNANLPQIVPSAQV